MATKGRSKGECQKTRHLTDHIAKNRQITRNNSGIAFAIVIYSKPIVIYNKLEEKHANIDRKGYHGTSKEK